MTVMSEAFEKAREELERAGIARKPKDYLVFDQLCAARYGVSAKLSIRGRVKANALREIWKRDLLTVSDSVRDYADARAEVQTKLQAWQEEEDGTLLSFDLYDL